MEFREDSPRYRAANGAKGRPKEYKPQNYMENSFKKSDNEQPAEQKHNGDNNSFEFDYDQSDFNINRVSNNFDDGKFGSFFHSKIGVEQSQELSKINRMYDVFYTEKQTLFYIEDFINQNESKYPREREKINESQNTERTSQLFGLEEEVKLNENETIRIVNTKVAYSGPSKHHEYKIIGRYMGEEFIIFRRFREFYLLNKVLHERWPGFYIPPVPKKKAYGNMNYKIITNRIFILNRFLFELSERKYLWESEEIRIFIKPENNLICELKALKSLSIEEVLERIRPHVEINLDINDNHIDDSFNNIKFFKEQVISNLEFLNKFKIFLRKQAEFVDDYLRSNAYLMDGLYVFENSSLEIYSRQT